MDVEFISFAEARKALDVANEIAKKADMGQDIILAPVDAELIVLGLYLIARVSEHAAHFPQAFFKPGFE